MCKFCSSKVNFIEQNLPIGKEYGKYNEQDSAGYFLLGGDTMHIYPHYLGVFGERKHSIFNIRIKYCPFCGKKLNYDDRDDNYDFDIYKKD